jgi:hypothetical protein
MRANNLGPRFDPSLGPLGGMNVRDPRLALLNGLNQQDGNRPGLGGLGASPPVGPMMNNPASSSLQSLLRGGLHGQINSQPPPDASLTQQAHLSKLGQASQPDNSSYEQTLPNNFQVSSAQPNALPPQTPSGPETRGQDPAPPLDRRMSQQANDKSWESEIDNRAASSEQPQEPPHAQGPIDFTNGHSNANSLTSSTTTAQSSSFKGSPLEALLGSATSAGPNLPHSNVNGGMPLLKSSHSMDPTGLPSSMPYTSGSPHPPPPPPPPPSVPTPGITAQDLLEGLLRSANGSRPNDPLSNAPNNMSQQSIPRPLMPGWRDLSPAASAMNNAAPGFQGNFGKLFDINQTLRITYSTLLIYVGLFYRSGCWTSYAV